ncbi:nuclear transport factor 2 family protein [Rhizobium sp. HT1-10]|uniref:nuclear transport factor 2 family protein n=1 Tax=Rhizobium sp. HT1-10 TaxID=3111638 RepID=UPI003C1DB65A
MSAGKTSTAAEEDLGRQRLATLHRFLDAWNARDVEALMGCMAANCSFHGSSGHDAEGSRHVGREAVQRAYAALFEAFPQTSWTERQHVVSGETGLSAWRFSGLTAAGHVVEVDGCDIFTFDGPLIALKDSYRKARS